MAKALGLEAIIGLAGFGLAALFAFVTFDASATLLVVVGTVMGVLTITSKERGKFFMAVLSIALLSAIIGPQIAPLDAIAAIIRSLLANFVSLLAPPAIVLGLAEVWSLVKKG